MIKLSKKYHFYAAHRNPDAGKKCGRIHGHCYDIVVHLGFGDFERGITLLFSEVDRIMEEILSEYDHYFILWEGDTLCQLLDLIDEPYKKFPLPTSAENMAIELFNQIKLRLPIVKIELAETKSSNIIYEGDM